VTMLAISAPIWVACNFGRPREEMHPWDEQENVLTVLFDFYDCHHIAVLAANCNCQLKPWGKLLPLPSVA